MTVIADGAGPEALGGVMGGEHSGCTPETVNVFIEAAIFDPVRTAMTGRRLGINSDARYRFERGIDPALLSPQPIHEIDVSTPTSRSVLILGMLDFFLILAMMSGGIYLAIDITAGERERGTLEPLLTLPVTRDALLIGKLLTTCAYMALSLSLTTAGFFIAMSRIGLESLGMSARLDPWAAVAVIAVALPLVPVGAGLLTLVASFTRSVREAQAWVGVVQLLPTMPLVFVTMANLAPRTALMAVPSLSQHFLILKLLRAEDIAPLDVALSAGCSLVLGGLLMAAAARIYRRDSLLS
jgi:sodium transport system permease protein